MKWYYFLENSLWLSPCIPTGCLLHLDAEWFYFHCKKCLWETTIAWGWCIKLLYIIYHKLTLWLGNLNDIRSDHTWDMPHKSYWHTVWELELLSELSEQFIIFSPSIRCFKELLSGRIFYLNKGPRLRLHSSHFSEGQNCSFDT